MSNGLKDLLAEGYSIDIKDTSGLKSPKTIGRKKLIAKIDSIMKTNEMNMKTNAVKKEGTKYDSGKPRVDLLPTKGLVEIAKVLDFGSKKYDAHNWRKGINYSRVYSALQRHLMTWNDGETVDPETGINHLAHAGCNILFLLEFASTHPEKDDRYKK